MRRWSLFVVLVTMASIFALSVPFASEVRAATLFVGGAGPGNYTTIQAAIDSAGPGDTLFVFSGIYYENVVVDKTLSLIGESRDTTVIDGGGADDTVYLSASWVNVTGFTITGGGGSGIDAGISLYHAHDCYIAMNNVSGNGFGIALSRSNNNTFAHNDLFSNSDNIAIYVSYSTNNTIFDNVMAENGIYVDGDSLEHWNSHTIDTTNTLNGKPVYYWKDVVGGTVPLDAAQVILANCSHWLVEGLYVDNTSVAIQLGFSSNNTIANNTAIRNQVGIHLANSSNNTIVGNKVSDNYYGIFVPHSDNNRLFHNVFINNTAQVYESGSNQWDDGYPSGGNYWSDYTGVDEKIGPNQDQPGSDGIGDTPYEFLAGTGMDRYPLMEPHPPSFSLPSFPLNLQADAGDSQVNLIWDPPTSDGGLPITNYRIYRGTSSGEGAFHIEVGNVTFFNDTSVTNGVAYFYTVAAKTFVGEGPRSNEASAIPATVPSAPLNLTAVAGNRHVNLTWHEPSDDGGSPVTNYTIFRGPAAGQETILTTIGNVLSYVDTGLMNGVAYYYRVAAVNGVGRGSNSTEVSAAPFNQIPECVISMPASGTVVSGSYTVAGISNDADGAVAGVEVKIDDGPWIPVSGTTSWSHEWDTTSVVDGNHTIHARSFDGTDYSDVVSVTVVVDNAPPHGDAFASIFEELWFWIAVVVIVVMLAALLVLYRRRKRSREEGTLRGKRQFDEK